MIEEADRTPNVTGHDTRLLDPASHEQRSDRKLQGEAFVSVRSRC